MVATRRSVGQELSVVGEESSVDPPPEVSADLNITTTQRLTRSRYKESSQSVVLSESQAEEPGAVAAKLQLVDLSEHPNLALQRTTRSRRKHEPHSDGDVSEAESNCSSVSSLQMPIVTRTTRSRQIKITCPSDSITKSKTKKSMSRTEPITESQEEGEVSEAESCCSSVSGIQMTCTTRTTRSRKNLVKIPPILTSEPQIEDVSDAESWCSGISVGPSTRRVTRSTTVKFQPETTNQSPENDIDLCAEEELLKRSSENGTEYQPLVVSDTDSKVKGDSATEETSFAPTAVSRNLRNRLPLPRRNEFQPEHEVEEKTQRNTHLRSSQATEKRKRNRIPLLNKNSNNTCLAIIDSEEELDQALEMEKVGNDSESQLVNVDLSQLEQNNKRSLSSQKHSPLKQRQTVSVHQQVDIRESVTSSCQQAAKLMGKKQSTERSQQNKDLDFTSIDNDMDDDFKIVEADTDIDQGEVVLQSKAKVNACTKETCDKSKVISLTPSHLESDTSEEEDDLSNMEASNLKPLLLHSSEDELPHVDGLFVIDKAPGLHSSKQYYLEEKDEGVNAEYEEQPPVLDEDDFVDEAEDLTLLKSSKAGFGLSTSIDPGLNIKDIGGLYISFDVDKQKPDSSTLKKIKEKKNNEELLQKSLLSPDFEKRECVPPYSESVRQLKKKRKEERAKTTGDGWFGMKAPEMTEELKNDLKALKMRSAMDPKRFYKKNDRDGFPKYFQVGTVVDNPIDFYHSRIPKKQRKRTIVEELLADSEFRRYNKKKYQQIMTEKASLVAGKKNRKKKKFCT